jgi:hypothetical protein
MQGKAEPATRGTPGRVLAARSRRQRIPLQGNVFACRATQRAGRTTRVGLPVDGSAQVPRYPNGGPYPSRKEARVDAEPSHTSTVYVNAAPAPQVPSAVTTSESNILSTIVSHTDLWRAALTRPKCARNGDSLPH